MTLIVEDGTGLSTANVYISQADADTYHSDRNNTAWAALSSTEKNAALLYATQYLDANYSWRGDVVNDNQALGMPTEGGYDDQGREIENLPARVGYATAEMALIHTSKPLTAVMGPRVIQQTVDKAVSRRFSDKPGNEGYRYPIIDILLKGLHTGGQVQYATSMVS